MSRPDLLLIGAGGHALACIDVLLLADRYRVVGLVGRPEEVGRMVGGFPVLSDDAGLSELLRTVRRALVTVGQIESPAARMRLFDAARSAGAEMPAVVSPRAWVSPLARVGEGTIVMHAAIVNAGAVVGRNCIINTRALVEHEATVGDHCHVATGAILNGAARLGEGSFVGSGAVVRNGVTVAAGAFVRMGEMVKRDTPATRR